MNKKHIWIKLVKTIPKFLNFSLFVQETQFIEILNGLEIYRGIIFDSIFKWISFEHISQKRVVHDKIVKLSSLLFLFLEFEFEVWNIFIEFNLPLLLKLLPIEECFPKYPDPSIKHTRISSFLKIFIDLSHIPFEFALVESLDISRYQSVKNLWYLLQLFLHVFAVKLEGAVGYTAVI